MTRPSAIAVSGSESLSFHTSYEDVTAEVSAAKQSSSVWALHDTGATHHVFKDKNLFDETEFKVSDCSNKHLKLAGGGVSLNVVGQGSSCLQETELNSN